MAFHNHREDLVPEMLETLLRTEDVERLQTLDGNVLLRGGLRGGRHPDGRVAVVSGGGSGHEPAHAGFLGEGMLDAAVPGTLFASPPVGAVLEAIRAVTGRGGCLLIIKNYTGDRLNFGLAAERAQEEGLDVQTVLVSDDVALSDLDQPRGLAGTVLVHKVAGHLAAQGASLEEVAQAAQRTAESLRTIGLALSPATLPGEDDGGSGTRGAELGLGIHNEPGAREVQAGSAHEAMRQVLEALDAPSLAEEAGEHGLVAVLNDLGGCSPQEGLVLARELLEQLEQTGEGAVAQLIGPARLMTSLDMHGFSVTLTPAAPDLVEALQSPTAAPAWAPPRAPRPVRTRSAESGEGAESPATSGIPASAGPAGPDSAEPAQHSPSLSSTSQGSTPHSGASPTAVDGRAEPAVRAACTALEQAREELDELDRVAGDADAGTTFGAGAAAVGELLDRGELGFAEPAAAVRVIARRLESAMGGSSGVLLAILLTAAARALDEGADWAGALEAGTEAVQYHGGAAEGDRTMLDALIPARRALADGSGLPAAAEAAERGAQETAGLTARAGRAAYVPEAAAQGTPDAGAVAVARFLRALAAELR